MASRVTMTWSTTGIPTVFAARMIAAVVVMSCSLGVGSPLG